MGRRQPRAGLVNGCEVSAGCKHLAGVGAAEGRFCRKPPPLYCRHGDPIDSATEVGEFDVGEDEAQGDIGAEEQVNVLE